MVKLPPQRFATFTMFYWYYLSEHRQGLTRTFHYVGTTGLFVFPILALIFKNTLWLPFTPIWGYGWAWLSHMWIEKNKPATFQYPLWSLMGDLMMLYHALTGQLSRRLAIARQLYPNLPSTPPTAEQRTD
jgi:hypothetical protein